MILTLSSLSLRDDFFRTTFKTYNCLKFQQFQQFWLHVKVVKVPKNKSFSEEIESQVSMKYDALCRAHLGQLLQSDGVDEKRTINGDTLIYLCDNQLIFIMLKPHRK